MTTQTAVDIFAILQDKYGSPDLDPDEVVHLLNMATYEWLNRLVPSNLGGAVNFELDSNTLANIKPLIYSITGTMNGSGVLTNAVITAALVTAGAEATATWYRIGNVGITVSSKTYPAKFVRHNDYLAFVRNYFKRGKATKPIYTIRQDGLKFDPIDAVSSLSLVVVKHPKLLSLVGPVNPELDDQAMYNIIMIALKFAGVSTRDEELIMDIRNTSLQTAQ
jgi:hypothetical protein